MAEDGQPRDQPQGQMGRAGTAGAQGSSNAPAPGEGPATVQGCGAETGREGRRLAGRTESFS